MSKIDKAYTFWFPIAIIGVIAILSYIKSSNIWTVLILYIYSLSLIIYSSMHLYKIYSIRKWKKINAKVEHVSYQEWYDIDRWLKIKNYSPKVTYSYSIDDKIHTSNDIGLFSISYPVTVECNGEEEITKFMEKYKAGTNIDIYVNPKNEEEAFLYNTVHWSFIVKYILLFLIGSVVLIGVNM